MVSDRCQKLTREFDGSTDDHVGGPNVDDYCLDALRDAVMGVAALEQ